MSPPGEGRWRGTFLWGLAVVLVATPVIGAAYPSALRIPRSSVGSAPTIPQALFSHRTHGTFGCFACHPSTFPQAPLGFTHADMSRGAFCGRCHDGHTTFAVAGAACERCHVPTR
jgi:c(7)-type cytochrome triheme protein